MLRFLQLGGDGDEVAAIERVERTLGIAFDIADCERFVTVGDVWAAARRELKLGESEAAPLWRPFVAALCAETGDDPDQVGSETLLLGPGLMASLGERLSKFFGRG